MSRIMLSAIVVFLMSACESTEERNQSYQIAHSQCTTIAAKTARAEPGSFGHKHESIAKAALNGCLLVRGFKKEVELAMEEPNGQ
jgi:hypothetical protein